MNVCDPDYENCLRLKRISYDRNPDYTRPPLEIPDETRQRLRSRLAFLYGEERAGNWLPELERILTVHHAHKTREMAEAEKDFEPGRRFSEKDLILISYGDIVRGEERSLLANLHRLVSTYEKDVFNTLHLLPFFPYSSDRGFSIVDFARVDRRLGNWTDIRNMGLDYDLMFDGVLNHCSSRARMFREFLNGNPYYREFFIYYDSPDALTPDQRKKIFRPRTSDILTPYHTINGLRYVWTTFSADQIDLNFRNPAVLIRIIEGLLFYVRMGADILRLDAVTYIWAEPGTECIHLPQTHEIVKLLRDVMGLASPSVALISETNVPHRDNVSYFGNGFDEAHMVYNFALPPLVLHTFHREDATALSTWAEGMAPPSEEAHFFNILDTHDGLGLMGVKDLLSDEDTELLIRYARDRGALISYKKTEGFTETPYEINTTWWSALNREQSDEPLLVQVRRYLASRSIPLVLRGIPGIYVHGLVGTSNDHELAERTGVKRDVNRGLLDSRLLAEAARDPGSRFALLQRHGVRLYRIRTEQAAFHPAGEQQVLRISPRIFSVLRTSPKRDAHILALTNVTASAQSVEIPLRSLPAQARRWDDLVSERAVYADGGSMKISLQPYDVLWLKSS